MGVHEHGGTMPGALTPICNRCGISLCWDISVDEYERQKGFWDSWICRDCNGGNPYRHRQWVSEQEATVAER